MVDSVRTLLVSIYVSLSTSTDYIKCSLLYNLMAYSPKICTMWSRLKQFSYYNMPIILTRDFNFNLEDRANYERFRRFTLEELGLTTVTDLSHVTTLCGSCIDIICLCDVPHIHCTTYTSYFSCHYPVFAIT
jgi:hypothetical protein